ncbi:MAG: leucyl aminopeptidase [Gammaproteobacteria bacterium]|nr:MAG: leucyl aminopeptidase [Gammaproteobacteria bacterium]
MDIKIKKGDPCKQRTSCVIVGVLSNRKLTKSAKILDEASDGFISKIVRRGDMDGDLASLLLLQNVPNIKADRVLLVGCGKEKDIGMQEYAKINKAAADLLQRKGSAEAVSYLTQLKVQNKDVNWRIRFGARISSESLYVFDKLKTTASKTIKPLKKLTFVINDNDNLDDCSIAVKQGQAITDGIHMAKNLSNMPANICTPYYLTKQATSMQKLYKNLNVKILDQKHMLELNMHAMLSVSAGSKKPSYFIKMHYKNSNQKPTVLIGKGVTFDSGGISLKPGARMDEMKYDMAGAAAVMGVMKACCELQLSTNLIVLIPTTENMPGGNSTRPGDVIKSMSGQTIEVLNTDAEGRLLLCDALTYAKQFEPKAVIDVATLTGACVVALGSVATGLLSNNKKLAKDLINAGNWCNDKCWQLPLFDEYQEQLDSNFADMANIGGPKAGTITAACFLSRFATKYPWAHLDIAGTAWMDGKEKGATGRPVSLLLEYICSCIHN